MSASVKVANDIFRQKWFRELDPIYKTLFIFLLCESNIIGVFEIDSDNWNFAIRANGRLKDSDPFTRFGNRIQRLPNHKEKGIIVGKLDKQVNFGRNSAQWQWVERELKESGLTYQKLQELKSHEEEQMELPLCEQKEAKPKLKELRYIVPPKLEWVNEYCSTRNNGIDPEHFFNKMESLSWKSGNTRIKDWQAAIRTWESVSKKSNKPVTAVQTQVHNLVKRKVF